LTTVASRDPDRPLVEHRIGWHIAWCTKYRRPVLVGDVSERLVQVVHEKAAERGWVIERIEVAPDLVSIIVRATPDDSAAHIAHQIKAATSRALRSEFPHLRSRLPTLWSRSFYVTSLGRVSMMSLRRYVERQSTKPGG
jgi:putative transposase